MGDAKNNVGNCENLEKIWQKNRKINFGDKQEQVKEKNGEKLVSRTNVDSITNALY